MSVQLTIQACGAYTVPAASTGFGNSLASLARIDGFADLAIGIRGQIVRGADNAGAIMITYGSAQGITATGARIINRSSRCLSVGQPTRARLGDSPKQERRTCSAPLLLRSCDERHSHVRPLILDRRTQFRVPLLLGTLAGRPGFAANV